MEDGKNFIKKQMIAKARGFTISIEAHKNTPILSASYGKDYNKLRDTCAKEFPEISELLPPLAEVDKEIDGYTRISVNEINTYAEQIAQMLSSLED